MKTSHLAAVGGKGFKGPGQAPQLLPGLALLEALGAAPATIAALGPRERARAEAVEEGLAPEPRRRLAAVQRRVTVPPRPVAPETGQGPASAAATASALWRRSAGPATDRRVARALGAVVFMLRRGVSHEYVGHGPIVVLLK